MNIDPTRSGPPRGPGAERLNDPAAAAPVRRDRRAEPEAPPPPGRDRVELSPEARELLRAQEAAGAPALSAERMKSVLERLAQGWYDRPEVRDAVIQRLMPDLEREPGAL